MLSRTEADLDDGGILVMQHDQTRTHVAGRGGREARVDVERTLRGGLHLAHHGRENAQVSLLDVQNLLLFCTEKFLNTILLIQNGLIETVLFFLQVMDQCFFIQYFISADIK